MKPDDNYLAYNRFHLSGSITAFKQKFSSTMSFGKYIILDIIITTVVLGIFAGVVILIVRVELES